MANTMPSEPRSTATILVVEDEPVFRDLLGSALADTGHHVEFAWDGQEALDLLAQQPDRAQVIVTDIQMPRMTGLELATQLHNRGSKTPILAMTGSGDMELVIQLLRLGVEDFLEKPFGFTEMTSRVDKILAKSLKSRNPGASAPFSDERLRLDRNPEEVRRLLERYRDDLEAQIAQGGGHLSLPDRTPDLCFGWKIRKVLEFASSIALEVHENHRNALLLARPRGNDRDALQLSMMVKILFEACWKDCPDPAELLARLGRILIQQRAKHALDAVCIFVDTETNRLRAASAGFPSPILVGAASPPACLIRQNGDPLGYAPNTDVETGETDFLPGDALVLPCPRLLQLSRTHPSGAVIPLGMAGFLDNIALHAKEPIADRIDKAWNDALSYANWHSSEDLLLVGIQRCPGA